MATFLKFFTLGTVSFLTACSTMPSGPDVMALPGAGLTFEQFKSDDAVCEHYAGSQIDSQDAGEDEQLQQRYDVAYIQCMYGKGHRVPVSGPFSGVSQPVEPGVNNNIPQPPEGTPPAPPPARQNSASEQ